MTDLKISKALALAIGYKPRDVGWHSDMREIVVRRENSSDKYNWRVFDYRDWNVIGPIAERYDVFPYKLIIGEKSGYWNAISRGKDTIADTPQKAIALAVIGAKK